MATCTLILPIPFEVHYSSLELKLTEKKETIKKLFSYIISTIFIPNPLPPLRTYCRICFTYIGINARLKKSHTVLIDMFIYLFVFFSSAEQSLPSPSPPPSPPTPTPPPKMQTSKEKPESKPTSHGPTPSCQVPRHARVKIHRLRAKVKELETSLKKIHKNANTIKQAIDIAKKYLNESSLRFFASQLRLSKFRTKGHRYTQDDKTLAFALYYNGPQAYKFLRKLKICALPTVASLKSWLRKVEMTPGFNDVTFDILKKKVESMPQRDRVCVLTLDEMSLKSGLYYDVRNDVIEGLQDLGSLGRTKSLASMALVFMVRGLGSKWKQPLSYFLCDGATPGDKQCILLQECINKLQKVGLTVKVVLGDQGSNNRKMFSKLGITPDRPYMMWKSGEENHEGHRIYFMFDPPHLLKNVRNNLKRHIFVVDGHDVKWKYIVDFYNHDSKLPVRMAPKLSGKHINLPPFAPMRVNLAAQVLSHSVAAGILTQCSRKHAFRSCVHSPVYRKN